MPGAIRIDIHLGSIQASDQWPSEVTPDLKGLAGRLSEVIRDVLLEFGGPSERDKDEGFLNPTIHPGLGPPWPPEKQKEPSKIGEGAKEHIDKLLQGEDTRTLMPVESYDNGAYHVFFSCDMG